MKRPCGVKRQAYCMVAGIGFAAHVRSHHGICSVEVAGTSRRVQVPHVERASTKISTPRDPTDRSGSSHAGCKVQTI
jgi:hypothetical protein